MSAHQDIPKGRGRLEGKVALVMGGGSILPGWGNGKAAAVLFAVEGAEVCVVDSRKEAAEETAAIIEKAGRKAIVAAGDATSEGDVARVVKTCLSKLGRIDVLHNNVGIGGGDAGPTALDEDVWDRIMTVNVKGLFLACKHVLPVMRAQMSGSIVNISSIAAVCSVGIIAYKSSKAAVNAFSHSLALGNARYGIRVNVIMPGLIDTPMAIEGISRARGIPKEDLRRDRDAQVPLHGKMGTAWDVANAALFLASDEARFITGVVLPVDGGQSARVG
jgi:NAD(P)-dependent dehydrogenase (short-subunit alcohol dehydrogenase family)